MSRLRTDLHKLFLQLEDGKTLPLLHDCHLGALAVRRLVAAKCALLPFGHVLVGEAHVTHVGYQGTFTYLYKQNGSKHSSTED